MKRKFSILLCVIILCSLMVGTIHVSAAARLVAEANIPGWGYWLNGTLNSDSDVSVYRDRNVKNDPSHACSMYFYKGTEKRDNDYICFVSNKIDKSKVLGGHTYVFSYSYRTVIDEGGSLKSDTSRFGMDVWSHGIQNLQNTNGGWWNMTTEFWSWGDIDLQIAYFIEGEKLHLWLDDLIVYDKDDPTRTNILDNNTFEEGLNNPFPDVTNAAAVADFDQVTLSWINPSDAELGKVRVYNADTGILLKEVSSPSTHAVVSGLAGGTSYNLKICAVDIEDTESAGVNVTATPRKSVYGLLKESDIQGWGFWVNDDCGNVSLYRDTVRKNSQNDCSMYIYKSGTEQSNHYIAFLQNIESVKYQTWHKYVLKYSYRTTVDNGGIIAGSSRFGYDWSEGYNPFLNTEGEWYEVTKEFTPWGTNNILAMFFVEGQGMHMWLDNVRVYDEADATQTNILINPTFVQGMGTSCGDVSNIMATSGIDGIDLSWTNPTDTSLYANRIYNTQTGALLMEVNGSLNSASISGLSADTDYQFKVTTVNVEGVESDGVTINASTLQSFVILPVQFSTATLVQGEQTATVNIKNNNVDDGINIEFIFALYKDGKIVDIKVISDVIEKTEAGAQSQSLQLTIDVPPDVSTGNYQAKAFVWDGLSAIKPLTSVAVLSK